MKRPQRQPIIPADTRDRTGTRGILRRAVAHINRRWAGLTAEALAIFARVRIVGRNDAAADFRTIYALTPDEAAAVSYALQQAAERWIASGREPAYTFWGAGYVAEASQLGAAQTVTNLTAISAAYAAERTLQSVMMSEAYRNRVAAAQIKSYDHWTGLSAEVKSTLSQIIGRAVVDGKNPRAVVTEIREKLDVSKAKARQYAQTDITDALREARMAERDDAEEQLGMNLGLLWTSAFLPTTRPTHAARHGKVYTSKEVRAFYSVNGNRYNCFLPGTRVAGRFVAGIQSHYKGPAVRLVTAGGNELAVTANHPVLTSRGMMPAAELREGDHLVTYRRKIERLPPGVAQLDGELIGAPIEQVFRALVDAGHQFSARVSPVDLHGDAARVHPEVDVVRADRELVFALDASGAQCLDKLALVHANAAAAAGGLSSPLVCPDLADARDEVRGRDVGLPSASAHLRHANALGVAPVADHQAKPPHGSGEGVALDAQPLGDRQHRVAGEVHRVSIPSGDLGLFTQPLTSTKTASMHGFHDRAVAQAGTRGDLQQGLAGLESLDELFSVEVVHYEGHVYDLQERSGLLIAECIVASNCHCAMTECLLDEQDKPILSDTLRKAMEKEKAAWQRENLNA